MKSRPHQRDHDVNQQVAKAVRPQLPRDGSAGQMPWRPGELPRGGFRPVFDFSERMFDTKHSPTSGGGKEVY